MAKFTKVILFLFLISICVCHGRYRKPYYRGGWGRGGKPGQKEKAELELVHLKTIKFPDGSNHSITSLHLSKKNFNIIKLNTDDIKRIIVEDEEEIQNVLDAIKASSKKATFDDLFISKIYRVENVYRFYQYKDERKRMKDLGCPTQERWLWFASAPAWEVSKDGFDVRKAYANGVLGSGIHFFTSFEEAFKHKLHLHSNGARRMVLALVALGVECKYDPKVIYAHAPKTCDSVLKTNTDGDMYAVYKSSQAYPHYIIEYYYDIVSQDN